MLAVPLQAVPSQTLNVSLNGQPCSIAVYQKTTGVYLDLTVNNVSLGIGMICLNAVKILRYAYLGFIGDLAFFDTQPSATNGFSDPVYTGFGSRFILVYLAPGDLGTQ